MSDTTKHVLILDAGVNYGHSHGELNHHFTEIAKEFFQGKGMQVSVTRVADGYDIDAEKAKLLQADVIFVQTPGFWMSTPWQLKKYEDECFGALAEGGDGRHRAQPDSKYGTGGVHKNKHYMLSCTWNAPLEAFYDPQQFFGGLGIDGVFLPLHKTFEFVGAKYLPTFMANDVIKNPQIEQDEARLKEHLNKHFG